MIESKEMDLLTPEKNETYETKILGFSSEGLGVCRIWGKTVFVYDAIEGEDCEIKILTSAKKIIYAKTTKILRKSPDRVRPSCERYPSCGGCDLLHMSYNRELSFKLAKINDALRRIGGLDYTVSEIIGAENITAYRNKAIFAVGEDPAKNKKNSVPSAGAWPVTGFFRRRTHEILSVDNCQIQSEFANRAANCVRAFMAENRLPPYDEKTGKGLVRHIFCRSSEKNAEAMLCIVCAGGLGDKTRGFIEYARTTLPELSSLILCVNKSPGNEILRGEFHTLWGGEYITETLCGLDFRLSAESFFQVNTAQAEKLISTLRRFFADSPPEILLDLYCGTGILGLCLAFAAKHVIGADSSASAIADAQKNAEINGVLNAEFLTADAASAADTLEKSGFRPDSVIIDPPRKGLSGDIISTIAKMSPSRLAYVSCDPATLARDLMLFAQHGYRINNAIAIDMFPRTKHVETVVMLIK